MLIFSDWTVPALKKPRQDSCIATMLGKYLNFKRSRWSTKNAQKESWSTKITNCLEWTRQILFRRWYESVSTFNLIDYSLKERQKMSPTIIDYCGIFYVKIIYYLGLKDLRDRMKYRSSKPLTEELWDFIFKQLESKSMLSDDPETAKRICSAKGEWILQDSDWNSTVIKNLLPYVVVVDVDYDQSILLWHIATEFCYTTEDRNNAGYNARPEYSKTLSDYMLYLLVMQPTMMSSVAGIGQIRFQDTCAEAKKFFSRRELGSGVEEPCERILEVNTDVKPVAVKGDRSKSVLFDACILAKELMKLNEKKWELMSELWVELLPYTASHCRADNHAQLLNKGGELVTFVWLLMAHFGIGEQFQINEGHARAKLIVGK